MKTKSLLMIVAVVALAITGCQKEKNKLDKRLTADTWKLSAYSLNNSRVTQRDYTSPSTDDTKNSETSTVTFNGTTWTDVSYDENISGATTIFSRETETYSYNAEVKFNEEGTFELKVSKALKTSKIEASGIINEETYVVDPTTETYTGYWVWGNNTSTKEVIFLDGFGQYTVELSKDELKLSRTTSSNETDPLYDFNSIRIGTETSTDNSGEVWTWSK